MTKFITLGDGTRVNIGLIAYYDPSESNFGTSKSRIILAGGQDATILYPDETAEQLDALIRAAPIA